MDAKSEIDVEAERRHPSLACACASLRRAARAVTQLYEEELRPTGLRATQYTLLQVLGKTGELGQGRLGEVLALDTTTLSRTLRLIERDGWVEGAPGTDRRERYWRLTPAGRAKWEEARPYWQRAQARLRKNLRGATWDEVLEASHAATRAATTG